MSPHIRTGQGQASADSGPKEVGTDGIGWFTTANRRQSAPLVREQKSYLIAIIDDATSEIHAEFFKSETTEGCLKVMRDYIEKKGLFKTLHVDKAGIFEDPKRYNFSQIQGVCEELEIEIIFANSPQGKGRIERSFDTFQDRLVPELRLRGSSDTQSTNQYL